MNAEYSDSASEPLNTADGDPDEVDLMGQGLQDQLNVYHTRQKRYFRQLLTIVVFFLVTGWFLWGLRDWVTYEFTTSSEPLVMGNVATLKPASLPHNGYVTIEGITEHRGMTQKLVRGLGLERTEYWYFRLLGSQGVFIEVVPDEERYGIATRVAVTGRVVDPVRDPTYQRLLAAYDDRFFPQGRTDIRIIQGGAVPGGNQTGFIVIFALLGLLVVSNLVSLVRLLRSREQSNAQHLIG